MTEPPPDDHAPAPQPHRPRPYPEGGGPSLPEDPPVRTRPARAAVALAGAVVLLLVLLVMVLVMTLGPTVLDRAAVERDVAVQFEEIHGLSVDLDCPEEMRVESGAEYSCTGTTDDGQDVRVAIRITDPPDDAKYTWVEVVPGG